MMFGDAILVGSRSVSIQFVIQYFAQIKRRRHF